MDSGTSAIESARRLLAQRSHRIVVAARLTELLQPIRVAQHNPSSKAVFGSETDEHVVRRLEEIEGDLRWCIAELEALNAAEAV